MIDFVMKIEHIGFVEAVERLADRIGYRLTYDRRRQLGAARPRHPHPAAGGEQEGRRVLRRRSCARPRPRPRSGSSPPAASTPPRPSRFGCGFAPAGWDTLTKHLLAAGFSLDELMKAGLSKEGRRGPIDRFHRRLLWPIRDLGGDVVGFGARRIFDDDPIEAKYLNTPETPMYKQDARAVRARPGQARDRRSAGRSSSSRATPTSWPCTWPACRRPSRPAARRSAPSTSA